MAKQANLKAVITLDSSPFFKGINKAMAFSKAAARQFARQPFKTTAIVAGLGGAGAIRGIASGITSAAKIGVQALKYLSVAGGGVAAIFAAGAVSAIHLGGELDDLSNRTGQTVANVLVLRKAFDLAGIGADQVGVLTNRLQRALSGVNEKGESTARTFALLGLDIGKLRQMDAVGQFQAIGDAINKMPNAADRAAVAIQIFGRAGGQVLQLFRDPNTFRQATESLGKQTGILQKNAVLFGQIEDKASRIKDRVQGFFVGLDSAIGGRLFNVLDKLGSYDLANVGKSFGEGVGKGIDALAGAFKDPKELGNFISSAFDYGARMGGNVLLAAFRTAVDFLKDGIVNVFGSVGQIITGALQDAFKGPIASLQAGIIYATQTQDENTQNPDKLRRIKEKADTQFGYMMHPESVPADIAAFNALTGNSPRENYLALRRQQQAEEGKAKPQSIEEIRAELMKNGGPRFGLGDGLTAGERTASGEARFSALMQTAVEKAKGFKVGNEFNANPAMMKGAFQNPANSGSGFTQTPTLSSASAKLINPETGQPYSARIIQQYLEKEGFSRDALKAVYGEQGGKAYDEKLHPYTNAERENYRQAYGIAAYNAAINNGSDLRQAPGSPVNGTGGMSLSYRGSGQGPLTDILGQTGAFSDLNTRLTGGRGFAPGVGSALDMPATSTLTNGFDGNAFLNATGTIHGYSSMNRLNADAKKAGLNKEDPILRAAKATARNTANTAKALGQPGSEEE